MESPSASAWSPELRLDRTDGTDGTTCLKVDGDIDMATGDKFRQTVMGLVSESRGKRVLLDVAGLKFIDSNGVTVLVKAHRAASEGGISFGISNVPDPIRGLLEMLGVYDLLTTAHAD
jgi:anti-sigma B factor antagonist